MKIKFGVIGCGSIARGRHLPEIMDNPLAEVAAVCDSALPRAREMAELYKAQAFSDYHELLALKELDAVVVCATNTTHAVHSMAALRAGKHVLCEKPMATTFEEAQAMIRTAHESGKLLMIAHNQRLLPAHVRARQILHSGRLGRVITFRSTFGHQGAETWALDGANTWFFDRSRAALGAMGDLGIHKIDLLRWMLAEEFAQAAAFVETLNKRDAEGQPISVDDNAVCLLKTHSGIMGTLTASWTYELEKEDNSTIFYCEKGVMKILAHPVYDITIENAGGDAEYYTFQQPQTKAGKDKTGIIDLFVDCIASKRPSEISGEEGCRSLQTVLACLEAARSGKTVRVDIC